MAILQLRLDSYFMDFNEICRAFDVVPEVKAYFSPDINSNKLAVIISGDEYDDELMDRLLNIEMELCKKYPDLQIRYVPEVLWGTTDRDIFE